MGGCAKKMAEAEISPEHFQRKVQQLSSLRVKSKQLPVKQTAEPSNKMTWTEIIELNRSINPPPEEQSPIDREIQEYLQSTKATIIRKRRRDFKTHINPHMAVNPQPSFTNKTPTMEQVNCKLDQEEIEQMFEMSTSKKKQIDSLPLTSADKQRSAEPRKKRRSNHPTGFENNDKENKDFQGQKRNISGKKKMNEDLPSASALNNQAEMNLPSKENIYDLVQENDVIEGTQGQMEDYSYISLRNRVTNIYYLLPKAQAGPLIVSKLDYDRYAV